MRKEISGTAKKLLAALGGAAVGFINGLFGSGGGMLAVPLLAALGTGGKRGHAASLAIIVPLSAVSAAFSLWQGRLTLAEALPYLPAGVLGAIVGGVLLARIPVGWLKIIFGGLLIWGGARLVLSFWQ